MYFKILVVFAFILHIYLHLCEATNLHRLFTIIFYWSKATFMVYLKNYIYIYMVFTTDGLFEVTIESWPEWDLNPRPLNSVQKL